MAGANRNSLVVKYSPNIVGMYTVQNERNDSGFLTRRADNPHARDLLNGFRGVRKQGMFVGCDICEAHVIDVFKRGLQAVDPGNIGRSRFELVGNRIVDGLLK